MASEQREEPLQGQTEAGVEEITASVKEIMLKNDDEYVVQYSMI
jgi:hypothetical protein